MKIGTVKERLAVAEAYVQGERTWYAFRTAPLRERLAEHILRQAGFAAFTPIEHRWVRVSRRARRRYQRPFQMIPRYVLVGFPKGADVPWHRIRDLGVTQGVVGWATPFKRGRELIEPGPICIPKAAVEVLYAASQEDTEAKERPMLQVGACQTLQIGEPARVNDGAFRGFEAIIEEIAEDAARASISIFGRPTVTWIPLDALDPV